MTLDDIKARRDRIDDELSWYDMFTPSFVGWIGDELSFFGDRYLIGGYYWANNRHQYLVARLDVSSMRVGDAVGSEYKVGF